MEQENKETPFVSAKSRPDVFCPSTRQLSKHQTFATIPPPTTTSPHRIPNDHNNKMASTTTTTTNSPTPSTSQTSATTYLSTFLNRTLHLHTTDGRMFAGQMKCTDPERNIILSMTHEYRQPSTQDIQLAAQRHERAGKSGNVKVDMKKRFVGLVVVPGRYISRIEVEE
jgi:small nuclear ribonucleoprotein (snRNP)-like protein